MLDEYRSEFVAFHSALTREYYLHLSGQKADLHLTPIYDRYSDLFSHGTIARLRQHQAGRAEHFETERAGGQRLIAFAVENFLEGAAKQLTEEISHYEARATLEWRGQTITFQAALIAIKNEADRHRRRALYEQRAALIEASNDLRAERLMTLHETARALGYQDYYRLYADIRGVNYAAVARQAESLLARTEAIYVARLDEALQRDLHIRISEAERADALRFFTLTRFDEHFPAAALMPVYRQSLSALGIATERQSNIVIDSEARPRKSPRPFCAAIVIPDEIKLVVCPTGGQADYQAFFHEAGHAQHYAGTAAELRPEFKYTSDYALTETYAFLFNQFVLESGWLNSLLGFGENHDFIRSAMLVKLATVRRYAAKLIYECDLYQNVDLACAASLYAERQTQALHFQTGRAEFLSDMDDGLYSANYLRAWAFEVMLRDHLRQRFGHDWWRSRRAGNLLQELWETGDRYSADEMAAQIGLGAIDFEAMIEEFNAELK